MSVPAVPQFQGRAQNIKTSRTNRPQKERRQLSILSPELDIVPNIGQNLEHVLHINDSFLAPDRNGLMREAGFFMFKRRQAIEDTIDKVTLAVQQWKKIFMEHEVPQRDIKILGSDIDQRIQRISLGN